MTRTTRADRVEMHLTRPTVDPCSTTKRLTGSRGKGTRSPPAALGVRNRGSRPAKPGVATNTLPGPKATVKTITKTKSEHGRTAEKSEPDLLDEISTTGPRSTRPNATSTPDTRTTIATGTKKGAETEEAGFRVPTRNTSQVETDSLWVRTLLHAPGPLESNATKP